VALALEILRREFEISMALTGATQAEKLGREILVPSAVR
jgi:isopentenyl diphosphate isomerase/L-lactate dehydrogenase-like FMN-dependent dehydrogenase